MDDTVSRQVVIAGAGIGGLTAALAFAERGYSVELYEQASSMEAAGAGIQLSPNATHILDRLGVLDRLLPSAVHPQAVILKDAGTLRELATVPLGDAGQRRWHAPYLVAHRGDLQDAMMAAIAETPEIRLVTGARLDALRLHSGAVSASFLTTGGTLEANGFLMIGADGVWSKTRSMMFGKGLATSRFTSKLAWRATITAEGSAGAAFAKIAAVDCVTAFLHPGFHLVAYPMRGGAAFNLVAFTKGERIAEDWSGNADPKILAHAMRHAAPALAGLAAVSGPWTAWPVHMVDAACPWTSQACVALIGDAAHAMPPFAAQGAAMAIEDAATLAAHVAASPANLPAALAAWEKSRKPRVAKVARRGSLNYLAWHAAGPAALARNLLLKMRPAEKLAADFDWLYGWRPPE